MFLSPEQFSKITGRPLAEVMAEGDAVDEANAEERLRRCKTLVLRPHHGVEVPVEVVGLGFPLDEYLDAGDLARLGVSAALIERLRLWQEGWQGRVDIPADPLEFAPGRPLSVRLARQLQSELPAHEIHLEVNGDLRAAVDLAP